MLAGGSLLEKVLSLPKEEYTEDWVRNVIESVVQGLDHMQAHNIQEVHVTPWSLLQGMQLAPEEANETLEADAEVSPTLNAQQLTALFQMINHTMEFSWLVSQKKPTCSL